MELGWHVSLALSWYGEFLSRAPETDLGNRGRFKKDVGTEPDLTRRAIHSKQRNRRRWFPVPEARRTKLASSSLGHALGLDVFHFTSRLIYPDVYFVVLAFRIEQKVVHVGHGV